LRDDIDKLPLPPAAKAYARRKGLAAMKRQPRQFQAVNAMLTNPGKPDKFKEYTAGRTTSGTVPAPKHAIKDSARRLVAALLDG